MNNDKYKVSSYFDYKLAGLESDIYTSDWTEVENFAHEKLTQGNLVEITNTITGQKYVLNPDEYMETFEGEFPIGPDALEESKKVEDKTITNKSVIKSYNETDYGWHNNATTLYGELLDGNWYSYVPDNESIEIYNAPITDKYIDTAYNYQTDDERADDEWFDNFQQEHNITSKYTQKEIFNLIDELDAKYFNRTNYKPVEESKKVEERYNVYTISEDDYNVYNSHKVDTVDTIEQAEDRVAELRAETGMGAYYEKVDEWWENNSKRLIDYVNQETPEAIADLIYDGNIDEYMDNTSKQIALDIYNQLGKEVVEKMLNNKLDEDKTEVSTAADKMATKNYHNMLKKELLKVQREIENAGPGDISGLENKRDFIMNKLDDIELDNPGLIKEESKQPAYRGKDLSDFKLMLKAFDNNGRHAQRGNWEIGRGGYDMWYEIYYNKVPVIRCINGNVEVETEGYEDYAKLTAEQYGDTYNEKVEETKSIPTLKQEIEKALDKTLTSKEFGFTPEDIKDFLVLDIKQEDDTIKVEVRAELDYEAMTKLVEPLDKIVQKYDKEAYFDMEDTGIAVAYINNKSKKITECDDEEYSDETNWAEEEASEADDRFENRYMNGGNGATFTKRKTESVEDNTKFISYEPDMEGTYTLSDMKKVYDTKVSDEYKKEGSDFKDWLYDMLKSGVYEIVGNKKKTEAVNIEDVKKEVEQDKQEIGIKGDIDTEGEAKTAVKKEVYQYAKQQGLDIEKLRKQGIELSEVAELLDKVVGNMVSKSIIEYEDKTGKSVTWDYDVTNNDIDIVITEL